MFCLLGGETGVADCLSFCGCVCLCYFIRGSLALHGCVRVRNLLNQHSSRVICICLTGLFCTIEVDDVVYNSELFYCLLTISGLFLCLFSLFYWCFKLLGKFVSVATLNICWIRFQIGFSGDMGRGYLQLGITIWSGEFRFVGYVLGDRLWCSCSHLRGINPSFLYSYSRNEFVSIINGTGFVLFLLLLS